MQGNNITSQLSNIKLTLRNQLFVERLLDFKYSLKLSMYIIIIITYYKIY